MLRYSGSTLASRRSVAGGRSARSPSSDEEPSSSESATRFLFLRFEGGAIGGGRRDKCQRERKRVVCDL